jgi:hypothetical protein
MRCPDLQRTCIPELYYCLIAYFSDPYANASFYILPHGPYPHIFHLFFTVVPDVPYIQLFLLDLRLHAELQDVFTGAAFLVFAPPRLSWSRKYFTLARLYCWSYSWARHIYTSFWIFDVHCVILTASDLFFFSCARRSCRTGCLRFSPSPFGL